MIKYKEIQMPNDTTFLIVEDESDIAEILEEELQEMKFSGKVYKTDNFENAKSLLEQNLIKYIISDWNLEGPTGLDLLKYIRATKQHKNIPFLMITGNDNIEKMLKATEEGSSDYLVKPWRLKELQQKVFSAWAVHNPPDTPNS